MSSSVTCHLARGDGSRWIVTAYRRDRNGVTVCAVRELEGREAGEAQTGGGSRRNALWRTRLEEEDRLEWRSLDGQLVATSTGRPGESREA